MDDGKLKSLAHWVNSVGVGPCVESVQQLQDGTHFIGIIKIINGDRGTQFCELPMQRFRLICSFLEDFYGISLQHHVDHTKILQRAEVSELAKVTALLLCSAVQGPKVDFFVDMITKLDMVAQTHLKEIIEVIVARGSGNVLQTNFSSVLYKKLNEEVCTSSPIEPLTPLIPGSKIPTAFAYSPVKALFNTPNMVSKMRDRKVLYDKIRKMEIDMANEKALRSDREQEMLEKNAVIDEKETKVNELKQQVTNLRNMCADVDSMRSSSEQLKLSQARVDRLDQRIVELESVRSANTHLERQVQNLLTENNELEIKVRNNGNLRIENERQKMELVETKQHLRELQNTESKQNKELKLLATTSREGQAMLVQQVELNAEQVQRIRELEEHYLVNSNSGESLNIITERRLGEVQDQLRQAREEMKQMKESFQAAQIEYQKTLITQVSAVRENGNKRYEELEKAATSKLNDLQKELHLQTASNAAAEQKLKEFSQRIHSLSNTERTLEQEVVDVRTRAERQEMTITRLEAAKIKLEDDANLTVERHQQQVEQLQAVIKDLKSTEGKLSTEVSAAKHVAGQQKEIVASLENATKAQADELESSRQQLKQSSHMIQQSQQMIESLEKQIQLYVETNATAEQKIQEFGQRVDALRDTNQLLSQEVLDGREKAQRQAEIIASLEYAKKKLEEEAKSSAEQYEQQAVTVQELNAVIKGLRSTEERLTKEVLDTRSEAKRHLETIEVLGATKMKLEEDAKTVTKGYKAKSTTVQELQATEARLSKEVLIANQVSSRQQEVLTRLENASKAQADELESSRQQLKQSSHMIQQSQQMIESLEKQIQHYVETNATAKQEIQKFGERVNALSDTNKLLSQEVLDSRGEVQCKAEIIASLEYAKKKLEEEAKSSAEQYEQQAVTVQKLNAVIKGLRSTEERLTKEVLDTRSEAKRHLETIEVLGATKMKLEEDAKTVTKGYKENSTTVQELQATEARLSKEVLMANQVSSRQQEVLTRLENATKAQADELESSRQQLKQSSHVIQQSQQMIESLEKQIQHYVEKNATAEQKIQEFGQRVDALRDTNQLLSQEVLDSRGKVQCKAEIIASLENAKKKLEVEAKSSAEQYKQQAVTVQELNAVIKGMRSTEERLSKKVVEARSEATVQELQATEARFSKEVLIANQVSSQQQEVITRLENATKTQANELESTRQQLKQSFETIQQSQQTIESLRKTSVGLKNSEGNLSQELSTARLYAQHQEVIIASLEQSKKNLEEELTSLRHQVQNYMEKNTTSQQKIEEFSSKIDTLSSADKRLKQEVFDLRTQNQHRFETIVSLETTKTKLLEDANSAARRYEQQAEELLEMQETIEGLRSTEIKLTSEVSMAKQVSSQQQQEVVANLENTTKMQADELESNKLHLKQSLETIKCLREASMGLKSSEGNLSQEVSVARLQAQQQEGIISKLQLELENQKRLHQGESSALKRQIASKMEQLTSLDARMRFEKDSSLKETQILQEELDHTRLLLMAGRGSVRPPMMDPLPADISMHSMDSLDDGELNLAELDAGSRASVASNTSTMSGRSTESSKSQCKYTIKIHSRQSTCSNGSLSSSHPTPTPTPTLQSTYRDSLSSTQLSASQTSLTSTSQFHLSTPNNMSDTLNLSHLGPLSMSRGSSSTVGDNLPEKVSQTIDELSTDHFKTRSLRASMRQAKISRRTTGRAGFCLIGACEEEPESFDWDRLAELQRRNTLCHPHLQTSYPVETQTRAPREITEDGLRLGATLEGSGEGPVTRGMRKRKSGDSGFSHTSVPAKMSTSNSYHAMPPPPPPEAKQSVSMQNIKTVATVAPSSRTVQNKNAVGTTSKHSTSTNSINSIESNSSNTSNGSNRSSSRFHRSGILRGSTKAKKSQKSAAVAKVPAVRALQESDENRRDSVAFSVGFSPKPQLKRRPNNRAVVAKATNSPKVQAATPGATPNKKSKRRSIAKWLGK